MLTIARTGETFTDRRGAEGRRLWVTVGPLSLPAIERGDGYKALPPGEYDVEFGWWTSKTGAKAKAIRVLGEYSRGKYERGRIYLHPSNWPYQLEGCIAPGLSQYPHGVLSSQKALQLLFDALGGWREGYRFKMEVKGS